MTKNDGGPAFASVERQKVGEIEYQYVQNPGMSLRDYFAGQALAGMHGRDSFDSGQATPEQRASLAYIDADAMIAERGKP